MKSVRIRSLVRSLFIPVFLLACYTAAYATEAPYQLQWVRQIGTPATDASNSVAVDGLGNAYISGYTDGSLGGPNAGYEDAFLAKYASSGALLWTRQIGTVSRDYSNAVAVDGLGNAYISGYTCGNLGGPNTGGWDAFLAKYDSSGSLLWTRQIGTTDLTESNSVAVDGAGYVYISGWTDGNLGGTNADKMPDAFLAKYDASGTVVWKRQTAMGHIAYGNSVAVDGLGNAYMTGGIQLTLSGDEYDAFLAKYNSSGSLLWTRQIGTTKFDNSFSAAVDALGNAYISGFTQGNLGGPNAGGDDAFLAKYNSSGSLLWTRQIGTPNNEISQSVALDGSGNVYISGFTYGSVGGPNAGYADAFLAKYDSSGSLLWTRQLGTRHYDWSYSVAVDGLGNAYISGQTDGSLGRPNAGGADAFLAKFVVPEPGTLALIVPAVMGFAGIAFRKMRR